MIDGTDDLLSAWSAGLTPDPFMTVSQWADQHRILSSKGANEPGRWRTSRTPYLRAIMDDLSPSSPVQRVVFMAGAQLGKTETGSNWTGFNIDVAPGPMLAVQPTTELGKRFSTQRVDSLIESTPRLRDKVAPARSRDSGNTQLSKQFPGGQLVITGANSAVGLRSMPARYLFCDEIDAYPPSADDEGDPVDLAEARTRTFSWRRKIYLVSTPTIKGTSRIERLYEQTDQRRFFVPCPDCGHRQHLRFERLIWDKGRPETVRYGCESCGSLIEERHKTAMLEGGEWRATATAKDPTSVGYHLSSLYSPIGWLSWAEIARQWEGAQGSEETLRVFKNTILAETWFEVGEAPDWQRLYDRRGPATIGDVPEGVLFLTAGADVQHDRVEIDVWGWGRGLRSWLVEHIVIAGDPSGAELWAEVAKVVTREWRHANGARMRVARFAIDTGDGRFTNTIYQWCRRQDQRVVMGIKGRDSFDRTVPVAGPTWVEVTENGRKIKRGVAIWTIAVSLFKAETYRWLRLVAPTDEERATGERDPAGFVRMPHGTPDEWFKQLCAEQLVVIRDKRGFAKQQWQQLRERNEALDCRVYARAATWLMQADSWSEAKWADLERQLEASAPQPDPESGRLPQPLPDGSRPVAGVVRRAMRRSRVR